MLSEFDDAFDVSQGIYRLSGTSSMEDLEQLAANADCAILASTREEILGGRTKAAIAAHDSLLFALGILVARLGARHCFVLADSIDAKTFLPAERFGVRIEYVSGAAHERTNRFDKACSAIRRRLVSSCKAKHANHATLRCKTINDRLELSARAASLPSTPEDIRAFLFGVESNDLICMGAWSLHKRCEDINVLQFNAKEHADLAVIKAWRMRQVQAAKIPRPSQAALAKDIKVEPGLKFVLAAPVVVGPTIWGVVDFDTTTASGAKILASPSALTVVLKLAEQIAQIVEARS
ncbi:hypothetical protein [Usitatibacter rugosus]|uniref:hypothetical protein n=1 Tax=Usitatibacter rugosus TaxID=2732067 RepID=UPI001489E221|nr:hypothetical protein [Usitatibacter rugosus]